MRKVLKIISESSASWTVPILRTIKVRITQIIMPASADRATKRKTALKRAVFFLFQFLFQFECACIKLVIRSLLRYQLRMAATLDDASVIQNHDHIRVHNR